MPAPSDRRSRGAAVEAAARAHLLAQGLRELAANASFRFGELDLVMLDPGSNGTGSNGTSSNQTGAREPCVVFVEVRYRRSAAFGGGAASIDAGKRRRLVHAAQAFLAAHRQYNNAPCRFDVIEADGDPDAPRLHWLRDAFRADEI